MTKKNISNKNKTINKINRKFNSRTILNNSLHIKIIIITLTIFLSLLLMPAFTNAYIESGKIFLLTVSESNNNNTNSSQEIGGVADLYLTIKPGTGRIFIDSFPLSKIDTQITMRFATEIACDFLDKDCSELDFFYTIRANSAIVGGPSAGAAATVLTVALLDEQKLDEKTILTGTINSGNLIGPVAGITAKTLAAQKHGFKKVLIPKWSVSNETLNSEIKIKVVTVSTLEEALYEFTGKNYTKNYESSTKLEQFKEYTNLMKKIATELCTKYGEISPNDSIIMPNLTKLLIEYNVTDIIIDEIFSSDTDISDYNTNITNNSSINYNNSSNINHSVNYNKNIDYSSSNYSNNNINYSNKYGNASKSKNQYEENSSKQIEKIKDYFALALDAMNRKEYYSSASFCFGGNVKVATILMKNYTNNDLKKRYIELLTEINSFEEQIYQKNLSTISDLETYMIVIERISDSKDALEKINPENISVKDLAYAQERFETAKIWSKFFNLTGHKYKINNEKLRNVCSDKISEAEERLNYLELIIPRGVERKELKNAYKYYYDEQYALCIFTASKVKADVDVILGALYVSEQYLRPYFEEKIITVKKAIAKQERNNIFPILGYSYYEYAMTLSRTDIYSALIYAENALELSNLDMYFSKETIENNEDDDNDKSFINIFKNINISKNNNLKGFVLGFFSGILFTALIILVYIKFLSINRDNNIKRDNNINRNNNKKNKDKTSIKKSSTELDKRYYNKKHNKHKQILKKK